MNSIEEHWAIERETEGRLHAAYNRISKEPVAKVPFHSMACTVIIHAIAWQKTKSNRLPTSVEYLGEQIREDPELQIALATVQALGHAGNAHQVRADFSARSNDRPQGHPMRQGLGEDADAIYQIGDGNSALDGGRQGEVLRLLCFWTDESWNPGYTCTARVECNLCHRCSKHCRHNQDNNEKGEVARTELGLLCYWPDEDTGGLACENKVQCRRCQRCTKHCSFTLQRCTKDASRHNQKREP